MRYDPDQHNDDFGSELRKRQTPELARRQRRGMFAGSVLFLGTAIGMLIEGANAARTGQTVYLGRLNNEIPCSGYEEAALALFAIGLYVYAFWWSARRAKAEREDVK